MILKQDDSLNAFKWVNEVFNFKQRLCLPKKHMYDRMWRQEQANGIVN